MWFRGRLLSPQMRSREAPSGGSRPRPGFSLRYPGRECPVGREDRHVDTAALIEALGDPAAYPRPVAGVDVRQTHISAVFLAGPFVYKVKKPVAPGFLDFTTLDRRLHFCRE